VQGYVGEGRLPKIDVAKHPGQPLSSSRWESQRGRMAWVSFGNLGILSRLILEPFHRIIC
jgi:hypothetical protein